VDARAAKHCLVCVAVIAGSIMYEDFLKIVSIRRNTTQARCGESEWNDVEVRTGAAKVRHHRHRDI
jgi:hypothetical protein